MSTVAPEVLNKLDLRYVSDDQPGFSRRRAGKGFYYLKTNGQRLQSRPILKWIKSLAIPPAWQNVWISPQRKSYLLCTGRDSAQRKQYRYHPEWLAYNRSSRFQQQFAFGLQLPRLRQHVYRLLTQSDEPDFDTVVATVIRLLDRTLIRIGNESYAKQNETYGITTLRKNSVDIKGDHVIFDFVGKSGVKTELDIDDPVAVSILANCQDLPGQRLFRYKKPNGRYGRVTSTHINQFLNDYLEADFTAKDFRTWGGTVAFTDHLISANMTDDEKLKAKHVLQAEKQTASCLNNKLSTARSYYINPMVREAYLDNTLQTHIEDPQIDLSRLRRAENVLMSLLADQNQSMA